MDRIRLTARADASLRCAWCHAPFGDAAEQADGCARCRTRWHPGCASDFCPTLGCGTRSARELRDPVPSCTDLLAWLAAVFLPLSAIVLFELAGGGAPVWRQDELWSWLYQVRAPEALRWTYPLLLGAMAAYMNRPREPSRWNEAGLLGGAVLAVAAFGLALLPLFRVGQAASPEVLFVGTVPLLALWAYLRAWAQARRRRWQAGQEEEWIPHDVWAVLFGASAIQVARTMNELWHALPDQPPSPGCWLATAAAASGHPRLTGATPIRFGDGRVRPITPQLRTFKAFELALRALAPWLHRPLRAAYDRLGPPLAARLGPRGATATWLILLPAQLVSRVALGLLFRDAGGGIGRTYAFTRAAPGRRVGACPRRDPLPPRAARSGAVSAATARAS